MTEAMEHDPSKVLLQSVTVMEAVPGERRRDVRFVSDLTELSWEDFLKKFTPTGSEMERDLVRGLEAGDFVGLCMREGKMSNFTGGFYRSVDSFYVDLPAAIVDRWQEVYRVVQLPRDRRIVVFE